MKLKKEVGRSQGGSPGYVFVDTSRTAQNEEYSLTISGILQKLKHYSTSTFLWKHGCHPVVAVTDSSPIDGFPRVEMIKIEKETFNNEEVRNLMEEVYVWAHKDQKTESFDELKSRLLEFTPHWADVEFVEVDQDFKITKVYLEDGN